MPKDSTSTKSPKELHITLDGRLVERFDALLEAMKDHDDYMEWVSLHRATLARMALAQFIREKERELGITPRR